LRIVDSDHPLFPASHFGWRHLKALIPIINDQQIQTGDGF